MDVLAFSNPAAFTVRVIKYHRLNPDRKWANSYELYAIADGTEEHLLDAGQRIVNFEVGIHRDVVIFDRLLISTWEADSKPYNPDTFISSSLSVTGSRASVDPMVALNQCLSVARVCATGRFGHLFYRGCLYESDVEAPAGKTILSDRGLFQTYLDEKLSDSGLSDYLPSGGSTNLRLVMVKDDPSRPRLVTFLKVQGVTTLPQDHAWFNRTTTPL